MTALDTAALLADVSPNRACGDNLEYDLDFAALERTALPIAEHVMGEVKVPAKDPDWKDVRRRAIDLLARSKDLRIAVLLLRALLRTDGIFGFGDGLQLLCALVTDRWDTVHPRLDPDEGYDPTARVNAMAALCDAGTFLRDLREATLIKSSAFGAVSWRDVMIVGGDLKLAGNEPALRFDATTLNAAFQDAEADTLRQVYQSLADAKSRIVALEQFLTEKVGANHALDFEPLSGLLGAIVKYLNQRLIERGIVKELAGGVPMNGGMEAGVTGGAASPIASAGDGGARLAEISSRDDVIRLLDRVCAYYARFEPASPVPLLLERAKRLVPLGFADIVRDLAPEAMPSVEALQGSTKTNGSG